MKSPPFYSWKFFCYYRQMCYFLLPFLLSIRAVGSRNRRCEETPAPCQRNQFSGHDGHCCFHPRRFQTFVFSRASWNIFCNNFLVRSAYVHVCGSVWWLAAAGWAKVSRTSCVTESIDLILCLILKCQTVYLLFLTQIVVTSALRDRFIF